MSQLEPIEEIYLRPGDIYFGGARVCLRTVLGSCVSVTFWHPGRRIGGMCHCMLPSRSEGSQEPNGLYADEVIAVFLREIHRTGTRPGDYVAKLFGGGRDIATCNVQAVRNLMAVHGFSVHGEHLEGIGHRPSARDPGPVERRGVAAAGGRSARAGAAGNRVMGKIRVLVVDDSAVVCQVISQVLADDPDFEQ